jgi:5-methylcytosine-specific restriction endonuclease McrA
MTAQLRPSVGAGWQPGAMTSSALRPTGSTRRWRRLRAAVLERDGYRCQLPPAERAPGHVPLASHVDHIVSRHAHQLGAPLPAGAYGIDDLANLRALCGPCNISRGNGLWQNGQPPPPPPAPLRHRDGAGRRWEW